MTSSLMWSGLRGGGAALLRVWALTSLKSESFIDALLRAHDG